MPDPESLIATPTLRQRQVLTILFSDLVGSTPLGRKVDAEVLADLLDELRDIWHQAAQRQQGLVLRVQGDGALIVFGYPQPCEDGGRRAAEAAFEIHERAAQIVSFVEHGLPPPEMRSGIAAGVVVIAAGDIERGRLDVVGDVANSAAGLLKRAPPGAIVAQADALGPHADFYVHARLDDAGSLHLLQRRAVKRRFDATAVRGLTPLIDRDDSLRRLSAFVNHQTQDAGRCLLLEADAGMGKTRLLEELLPRAALRMLYGACDSFMVAGALQPFMAMLREQAPEGALPQTVLQAPTVEQLLEVFRDWAKLEPLTLVVDDWQWADDASRQLVQVLLQQDLPVVVLLACRPREDGARWFADATYERLQPLSPEGTAAAARRWLPQLDPFLAARIHAHTGGVPLYVEELCHASSVGALAQSLDERGGTPSWLAAWVAGRLGALPAVLIRLVRAAAAAGMSVSVDHLQTACGVQVDEPLVRSLADAGLLYPGAGGHILHFKHGLTREAVYESTTLAERRQWHAAFRELLERDARATVTSMQPAEGFESLAYHCRGAGQWLDAARYGEQAGDRASAAFALDSARRWYLSAMDALDRVPERSREMSLKWCSLSNKLGMTCIFDPLAQRNDAGPFEKAVALASDLQDANAQARALYWLGYMYYGFGRFRAGERQLRAGREIAESTGDMRLAAQVDATLAQVLAASSRYDEALRLFDLSLAAKQRQAKPGSSIAIGSAYSLACKGSVLADQGAFMQAQLCFDEALALLGDTTHPVANSVRNWVAVAHIWQGRWDEAERIAAESARIAENTRGLLLLVVCRAAAGYARRMRSGDPQGLQQLVDAVAWMDSRGGRFYTSLYHGWLAEVHAQQGDLARARRHAAHVLWRSREGERLGEACASRALARLALAEGDTVGAARWLARAQRSAQLRGSRREAALNALMQAEFALYSGDELQATALREHARVELDAMAVRHRDA